MADAAYQLPSAIRTQLGRCIKDSFKGVRSTQGSSALAVVDAVNSCIRSLLSEELLDWNARHSLQNRLPVELWFAIWEWLPFIDRMRILDVCKAWRSIARTTPLLWSDIRAYSAVHNRHTCRCPDCLDNDPSEIGGWSSSPYRKNSSNVESVRRAFSMGGDTFLHLAVDIVPSRPVTTTLDELSEACGPHAARIEEIHWRSSAPETLHRFLSNLTRFPSLRRMTVEWLPDIDPRHEPGTYHVFRMSDILPPTLEVPNLGHLSLDRMRFPDQLTDLPPLPALRSLSLLPQYPELLVAILRHCPRLTFLTVDFSEAYKLPLTPYDDIAQQLHALVRSARLAALHVRDFNTVEDWALPAFHLSRIPVLSLQYGRDQEVTVGHLVFGDLKGSIRLSCTRVAGEYRVQATDDSHRTRALLVDESIPAHLDSVYDTVLPHKITSLTIDLSLWREVALVPLWSDITTLTLIIPDRRSLTANISDKTHATRFSSLETLYITSDPARDPPLTIEDVVAMVPRLGIRMPLPHTVIGHRIARRGQQLPAELSLRTSVE